MSALPTQASREAEPIRLFKSDFFEFFTHISPVTICVVWVPVGIFLFYSAVVSAPVGAFPWHIPAGIILGVILWTITEYTLHRWLFHYKPRNPVEERIFFLFHGVHHAQPQDPTRLVMPLVLSIPMSFVFFGLFYGLVGVALNAPLWVYPLETGFLVGYLVYDLTHYATHHFPMRSGYWKFIKRYHMAHHYKAPERMFGVSSPVWDYVFGTPPPEE